MNYPTRVDPAALGHGDWNQNPDLFAAERNGETSGLANRRIRRDHKLRIGSAGLPPDLDACGSANTRDQPSSPAPTSGEQVEAGDEVGCTGRGAYGAAMGTAAGGRGAAVPGEESSKQDKPPGYGRGCTSIARSSRGWMSSIVKNKATAPSAAGLAGVEENRQTPNGITAILQKCKRVCIKYAKFIGPGFLVSVAYIDPGNYATDVSAGAAYKFKLLVMVLVSSIIAVFLQSLCIKLGSVTGMNLAENIRAHCPPWLNLALYFLAEAAIIVTDMAEVIGTAIALNLLIKVPLVAGCAISILDVLIILLFYNPQGSMRGLRVFEVFVMALVLGVVICFCIELSLIQVPNVGEVFKGFLPSSTLVQGGGLYQATGILGATVMPHSLYLGSGLVQPRLREYDVKHGLIDNSSGGGADADKDKDSDTISPPKYRPSIRAIRSCLWYSVAELSISLLTFALFVNSAILIVAGAALSGNGGSAANATLFQIHDLLSSTISPGAGVLFGLALLLSGTSAGIVCTMAGQMVSEGQLAWSIKPWKRRLMTRTVSIAPSIIIAASVGKQGLSTALEASQVALSIILPFVSAPLIYFTCRNKYMTVTTTSAVKAARPTCLSSSSSSKATVQADADSTFCKETMSGILGEDSKGAALSEVVAVSPVSIRSVSVETVTLDTRKENEKEMGVLSSSGEIGVVACAETTVVKMRTHWITTVFGVLMWLIIVIMNVASIVLLGLGDG